MRVLVCGGREVDDKGRVFPVLDFLHATEGPFSVVIAGGANGADTLAVEWAAKRKVKRKVYPADWKWHGRKAGRIRNQQMLDEGKPELVVAFPGKGPGTYDMIARATEAGVRVLQG